jgi:hypothetical protein
MTSLNSEINSIISKLNDISEKMKEIFHLPPYHYVELFIYFNNFIEDELSISKESFISANSSLAQIEDEDDETLDSISNQIYNKFTSSDSAPIFSLYAFLKTISINDDLNDDILFQILDKDEKGYIDYSDIEVLISSFEDFTNERYDWSDFEQSFEGKKMTKRNLSQGEFDKNLINLFNSAEKIINKKVEKSFNACQNFINSDDEKSNNNKFDKNSSDDEKSNETNNNSKIINEKKKKNNQGVTIYANASNNINNQNINYDTIEDNLNNISIEDIIFDKRKEDLINQIKLTSFLYDISFKEFISEFSEYKEQIFDKMKFINVILDIIKKKTSNIFKSSVQKLALSMLFQIIDIDHNNKVSYYEIMGAMLFLTKGSNEERLSEFFNYTKNQLNQIICGFLSLYLNSDIIKDYSILSDIFVNVFAGVRIRNSTELFQWIFTENKNEENDYQDNNFDDSINNESTVYNLNENKAEALKALNERYLNAKKIFSNELESLSIIDVTHELLNNSLLGQINNFQLSNLLEILLNWKLGQEKTKERAKMKNDIICFIEKYFDFSQNELVDITNLHSLFLLMFTGTTIEKIRSIFNIYEIDENSVFETEDLVDYISNLFKFLLKEMNVECGITSKNLAELFVKSISKGKDKISLIDLVQGFEYIVLE